MSAGNEYPRRDLGTHAHAPRGPVQRSCDSKRSLSEFQRRPDLRVELDEQACVHEGVGLGGFELLPGSVRHGLDRPVKRKSAAEGAHIRQSGTARLPGEHHGPELGHACGGCIGLGRESRDPFEHSGWEVCVAGKPQVGAQQALTLLGDGMRHGVAQSVEPDECGDSEGHAPAVEAEPLHGGPCLASRHCPDEAEIHRVTVFRCTGGSRDHAAGVEANDALCARGDLRVVGHDHQRRAALAIQFE